MCVCVCACVRACVCVLVDLVCDECSMFMYLRFYDYIFVNSVKRCVHPYGGYTAL